MDNINQCQFDLVTERRGSGAYKWDSRSDIPADTIPLWVADMDFRVAQPIIEAMQRRLDNGVFGYTYVGESYYKAVMDWFSQYHGWQIERDAIIYTIGVVPAISAIIKAVARPGNKVLMLTPVYNCFYSSIKNNGCEPLESQLVLEDNHYSINFDDLEAKAADPECTVMLLCNPHNPAGRVWTSDELMRIGRICTDNGIFVVSDEIHCELVFEPNKYTPYGTLSFDKSSYAVCISPSKAFNIAGLQIANIVAPDPQIRARIDRAININEVCDVNPFGVEALKAAYNESRPWLLALLDYIHANYCMLAERFKAELPALPVIELEGTYLAWIDCRHIDMRSDDLEEYLIHQSHVWINSGSMYGTGGEGFIRVNLACPRHVLSTALDRMIPVLQQLINR